MKGYKIFDEPKRQQENRNKLQVRTNMKQTANKMTDLNPMILIIKLNVNGQSIPIKNQRLSQWIKKKKDCLQERNFKYITMDGLKIKEWKKDISCKQLSTRKLVWLGQCQTKGTFSQRLAPEIKKDMS